MTRPIAGDAERDGDVGRPVDAVVRVGVDAGDGDADRDEREREQGERLRLGLARVRDLLGDLLVDLGRDVGGDLLARSGIVGHDLRLDAPPSSALARPYDEEVVERCERDEEPPDAPPVAWPPRSEKAAMTPATTSPILRTCSSFSSSLNQPAAMLLSASSDGSRSQAAAYRMSAGAPTIVSTAMTMRTMTGSMLRYLATPEHTPATHRSSVDRLTSAMVRSFCGSNSSSGPAARGVSCVSFIHPSWSTAVAPHHRVRP